MRWYVYVIHFSPPYKNAAHYTGITPFPAKRWREHTRGRGANLTRVAVENGSTLLLYPLKRVRGFRKAHALETRYKKQNRAAQYCPFCKAMRAVTKRKVV